jgi:hypothetical protein
MMYREISAVCSEIHRKHNTLSGQNVMVHIVTTRPCMVSATHRRAHHELCSSQPQNARRPVAVTSDVHADAGHLHNSAIICSNLLFVWRIDSVGRIWCCWEGLGGDLDGVWGETLALFLAGHNLQGWAGRSVGAGLSRNCTGLQFISCSFSKGC